MTNPNDIQRFEQWKQDNQELVVDKSRTLEASAKVVSLRERIRYAWQRLRGAPGRPIEAVIQFPVANQFATAFEELAQISPDLSHPKLDPHGKHIKFVCKVAGPPPPTPPPPDPTPGTTPSPAPDQSG